MDGEIEILRTGARRRDSALHFLEAHLACYAHRLEKTLHEDIKKWSVFETLCLKETL